MASGTGFWEVFRRSNSPMLVLDDDGRYMEANRAMCTAVARPRDDLLSQRVGFLCPDSMGGDAQRVWVEFLRRRRMLVPWQIERPDRTVYRVDVAMAADMPRRGSHLAVHLARRPAGHRVRDCRLESSR
jgi:PAS domain-containing protein